MIINAISAIGLTILNFIANFMPNPDPTILSEITSGTGAFRSDLVYANWLFPVDQILIMFGSVLIIELSLFTLKAITYTFRFIPFING